MDYNEGQEGIEELKRLLAERSGITVQDAPLSLETSVEIDEDDRDYGYTPFLTSTDTDWINSIYNTIYPLPVSKRHRETFTNIITNLSRCKDRMKISLHKSAYKDSYLPPYLVYSKISEICGQLVNKGYISIEKGYKLKGREGVPTVIEPTEKLLSLIPPDMSYSIMEEGLVLPREFLPDTFPPHALETRKLLYEYNQTVEPENMLYATHKGSFDLNGRFTGSSVIRTSKEDRKHVLIDGEATVELDISNCLPFILYASELGAEAPVESYAIKGLTRSQGKKAFLMAVNCLSRSKARSAIQYRIILDNGLFVKASDILDQIEVTHREIWEYHYSGIGTKLMFIESRCMALFMRSMLDKGIKFYPIYDSVRVPVSKRHIAEGELKKAFTVEGIEPEIHEE